MKLLIAGGGTGGHVFPAIAVAREWLKRGEGREVVIVGTERGLEMKLVPQAGLPLETIRVAGLKGVGGARLLRNVAQVPLGLRDSAAILRRHRVCAAFGVGGYASGPMMLMAVLQRVPTVIFEPNAEPGFANRRLAPFVTRIATAHEGAARKRGRKAAVTGCPVRAEFYHVQPKPHQAPFNILITGGSQGALPINRAVVDALDLLSAQKKQLFIVHQTGERGGGALLLQHGGAFFPGGPDHLPVGSHHRRGNCRREPRRHLCSLCRGHRWPPVAQRAGVCKRRRRENHPPARTDASATGPRNLFPAGPARADYRDRDTCADVCAPEGGGGVGRYD
jgi:hypothetical protein